MGGWQGKMADGKARRQSVSAAIREGAGTRPNAVFPPQAVGRHFSDRLSAIVRLPPSRREGRFSEGSAFRMSKSKDRPLCLALLVIDEQKTRLRTLPSAAVVGTRRPSGAALKLLFIIRQNLSLLIAA